MNRVAINGIGLAPIRLMLLLVIPGLTLILSGLGDSRCLAQEGLAEVEAELESIAGEEQGETRELIEGSSAEDENIFAFNPALSVLTAILVLALIFGLAKVAWEPLVAALNERDQHIQTCLDEARQARAQSEALLNQYRRELDGANEGVREILEAARRDATDQVDAQIREAQDQAETHRRDAEERIAQTRDQALAEIDAQSARLAAQVTLKVLDRAAEADQVDRLAKHIRDHAETTKQGGLA